MKRIISGFLAIAMMLSFASCKKVEPLPEPEFTQMKYISELAVMKCYYHNVVKYYEELEPSFFNKHPYKHFWVEYEAIIKYGIDADQVELKVDVDTVTITLPEAKVLSAKINEEKLNRDCYIVDVDSEKITAEDEKKAITQAQEDLIKEASKDEIMLSNARHRAALLLEEYVKNIGNLYDRNYTVEFIYPETTEADSSDGEITVNTERK